MDVFRIAGELTSREVPALYKRSLAWRTGALPATIDLAAVTRADSSALALLLEWQSWAHGRNADIRFTHPPQALLTFASLSDVGSLLGWAAETH
jgi:phospholipid transport system transporter-binding protein